MRAALFVSALTLMIFIRPAFAADDTSDSSVAASASVAPGIDVRSIIASVSQRTHKKFLVDPRVAASINLVGIAPRDVTYPLLLTILAVHAFAVYEQEGVIVVTRDAEIVTTIVVLKNAKAPQLAAVLRPLISPAASVQGIADRNALIIVDRAANVRRMVTLIRELDKLPSFKTE
jgi:general secretion pathway protein D